MIEMMSDDELMRLPTGSLFVFDVETYRNFCCVAFKELVSGKHVILQKTNFEELNRAKLAYMLWHFCLVGFNSEGYDIPIVTMLLEGRTLEQIKEASDAIILGGMRVKDFEREFRVNIPMTNHVDLIEVAPLKASLKLYGGRLHCPVMKDLPYDPHSLLTSQQMEETVEYCCNDLENTRLLLIELFPHIELRQNLSREVGRDLRSLSDAQVAEAIIGTEIHRRNGRYPRRPEFKPGTSFFYKVPTNVVFQTELLQNVLMTIANARFVVGEDGACGMPAELSKLKIRIGHSVYKLGMGGLHSTEKEVSYTSGQGVRILDRDVASYYPQIVLNQELYPAHLGRIFLEIFQGIVNRRLAAKKAGEKKVSEGLKIAINGTFGKLGSKFSFLYAPDLMLQVTISGQLYLLMLIEAIELIGITVISGNTDGVVIMCPETRYDDLLKIIKAWEAFTGFVTEETEYQALYSRDVNNYIAVKKDRTCKTKGTYCERGSAQNSVLSKNPESLICSDAVQALITSGKPVDQTIKECQDIRRFVTVRQVNNGGAMKRGRFIGKSIRWYYAVGEVGTIDRVENGNKVPMTEGAKPLMTLPSQMPTDVDYKYYIDKANEILYEIGYKKRAASLSFF